MKVLNLYAGIGGNRKLWTDVEVTAIEINPKIAKVYKDFFPDDLMIVADAHEYLLDHFKEYDFIWSSPPCPSHSRMRKRLVGNKNPIYPNMDLWQQILFLQGYYEGLYCIENVRTWYDPLIQPQELGRHYYWSNFIISKDGIFNFIEIGDIDNFDKNIHLEKFGYNLDKYKFSSDYPIDKIVRNMVHPNVGLHILECALQKDIKDRQIQTQYELVL